MANKDTPALDAPFQGRWLITEMDLWDAEVLNLVEPAYLEINGAQGKMGFIAVQAFLDVRYEVRNGGPIAEFSFEGNDDGDRRSGRGRAAIGTDGRLFGHLYFHMGDESAFVCVPHSPSNSLISLF